MWLLGACKNRQGQHSKSISSDNTHKGNQTVRFVYLGSSIMENRGSHATGQFFSMHFLMVGVCGPAWACNENHLWMCWGRLGAAYQAAQLSPRISVAARRCSRPVWAPTTGWERRRGVSWDRGGNRFLGYNGVRALDSISSFSEHTEEHSNPDWGKK